MTIFYSSDFHLAHYNIIQYSGRPFGDTREMDETLLMLHNQKVKPSDHWWCLGDLTMRRGGSEHQQWFINLIKQFNGHKRLLLGNHDHFPIKTYIEAGFEKVLATHRYDDIIFSHIPIHPGSMDGAKANVHGHTHDSPDIDPILSVKAGQLVVKPYINICVEKTNYAPLSLEEIKERITLKKAQWSQS